MTASIGKNIPRLDGYEKVTGGAKYIDDIDIPGCWFGAVVRSKVSYGKIKSVKYDPLFDWSRVVTCDWKDIPGKNATIFLMDDQPILAKDFVRHIGEAIILVAAPTKELAKIAASMVRVEYEELKPLLTIEESKKKKNIIWGKDNIQSRYRIVKGSIKKGFEYADCIVEGEYRTGFHEHIYIEPQGMAAVPRSGGGLTVMGSMQCPFYVLKTLMAVLQVDETKINVVETVMGGAFGGKEDYPSLLGAYVALLSLKSGHPVKIVLSRDEDICVSTKRHPSITRHKTGVRKDGTITAMEIDFELEGGAYSTLSPVVLSRGVIHSAGPFKCENIEANAACYATNNVPTGAFRGFGAPQAFWALECHIDAVAEKIGMNPYEFRLKNCVRVGDSLATTQLLKESVAAEECLQKVVQSTDFVNKWNKYKNCGNAAPRHCGTYKGIGLSLYMHGGAFTGSGEAIMKTEAALKLEKSGRVSILTGVTDMGQGSFTVLPQIAADALGISVENIRCVQPDTAVVPDSGPTVASRVTMIIGDVMEKCAAGLKDELLSFIAGCHGLEQKNLDIIDGNIFSDSKKIGSFGEVADEYLKQKGELVITERYKLPSYIKWDAKKHLGDAYPAYSWAATVAEVTVDIETFQVVVDKISTAVDVGKAINPMNVEGQIDGGMLQSLGWCLMEDCKNENGFPKSDRLQTYIIPTVVDMPEFETHIIEYPFSAGPHGAKGVGELPLDGGAPAIANAIYNATGIRVKDLPITAEKLYSSSMTGKSGMSGQLYSSSEVEK